MHSIDTLHELLIDELQDLYFAETRLTKALPKFAKAATHPDLKSSFAVHLEQTHGHLTRLEDALKTLGTVAKGKTCHAMLGLIEEGEDAIALKGPAPVRDAALIGASQRVEHYEIAGYGTARAFAECLGEHHVVELLKATLDEEAAADKKLTQLSRPVNADALAVDTGIHAGSTSKEA